MVNRTLRAKLIELIAKSYLEEHRYELVDTFRESLQEKLNLNLNFETIVSDIRIEHGIQYSDIYFNNDEGKNSVVHVSIFSNAVRL